MDQEQQTTTESTQANDIQGVVQQPDPQTASILATQGVVVAGPIDTPAPPAASPAPQTAESQGVAVAAQAPAIPGLEIAGMTTEVPATVATDAPVEPIAPSKPAPPGAPVVDPMPHVEAMTLYLALQKITDADVEFPRVKVLQMLESALRADDERRAGNVQALEIGDKLIAWKECAEAAIDLTKGYKKIKKCNTIQEVALELDSIDRLCATWMATYVKATEREEQ
ncbi:MAG: hypothetical protein ACHREM_12205 [Polyangiales bacterium]